MLNRKLYSGYINKLNENEIFVFGSNPEGLHGKRSVSKEQIIQNINELYMIARHMKNYEFYIAYKSIGYNLNGYTSEEMAEMFLLGSKKIPRNIIFEDNCYCLMNKVNK